MTQKDWIVYCSASQFQRTLNFLFISLLLEWLTANQDKGWQQKGKTVYWNGAQIDACTDLVIGMLSGQIIEDIIHLLSAVSNCLFLTSDGGNHRIVILKWL